MVYCASSLALAALECLVHFDLSEAPSDYAAIAVEIPRELLEALNHERLPDDWRKTPAPESLQRIGLEWIRAQRSAALRVPSAIIPDESNYLINPKHADIDRIRCHPPRAFEFDPRLFVADG